MDLPEPHTGTAADQAYVLGLVQDPVLPEFGGGDSDRAEAAAYEVRADGGVGAEYRVASCDLRVFVEESAEPVASSDLDVGVDGVGKCP
jgi:hypothetical protein